MLPRSTYRGDKEQETRETAEDLKTDKEGGRVEWIYRAGVVQGKGKRGKPK